MHLPDGILDVKTTLATGLLAAGGVSLALWQANRQLTPRQVPLLGVTAAFVFAAQMLNFPILPGISGHLLGGVLAAALLGPAGAVIALTAVLVVQCFLFQDGGVTALGANIFNLAIVGPLAGSGVYTALRRVAGPAVAAGIAGWCATVVAALAGAAQLAWSGLASWRVVWPAMAGVHAVIGLVEGGITGLVLAAIQRARPELLERQPVPAWPALALGLVAAIGVAWLVSPFACRWPDGLEHVAGALGFDHASQR